MRLPRPDLGLLLSFSLWSSLAAAFVDHVVHTTRHSYTLWESSCGFGFTRKEVETPPLHVEARLAVVDFDIAYPMDPQMDPNTQQRIDAAIDGCWDVSRNERVDLLVHLDREGRVASVSTEPDGPLEDCVASALDGETFTLHETVLRLEVDWKRR